MHLRKTLLQFYQGRITIIERYTNIIVKTFAHNIKRTLYNVTENWGKSFLLYWGIIITTTVQSPNFAKMPSYVIYV